MENVQHAVGEPPLAECPELVGTDVAVSVLHLGFYSLNACRIVYVVDEEGPMKRFGFAYGTLAEHAESGEERFTIEWDRNNDEVWYDILAFSRPRQTLARLGIHCHGCFKGDLPRVRRRRWLKP
jgi:uncharacterized protein (UPF0548 family)